MVWFPLLGDVQTVKYLNTVVVCTCTDDYYTTVWSKSLQVGEYEVALSSRIAGYLK